MVVGVSFAQSDHGGPGGRPSSPASEEIRAVRIAEDLRLDGRLTEACWSSVPRVSDLIQRSPVRNAPATQLTEIAFVYDDQAVYVGGRMYADRPETINRLMSRRDEPGNGDRLIVTFDTYHDRRTSFSFGVTAAGVRLDWYHPHDSESDSDPSFDPVWEVEVTVDSLGWTAEMRIPFSQLRFNQVDVQTWGVNVSRYVPARNELDYLTMPRPTRWASNFRRLVGIEGVRQSRRLELTPFVAGAGTFTADPALGDPFDDGSDMETRVGLDMKVGLGPNGTLEATVTPDFGQVEADPAEVNLSAFETFFPERRPFFREGAALREGGGQGYFYSRRIGAAPPGSASGHFIDQPKNSTILGAAKITGRLRSGLSVAALSALTRREHARTLDTLAGAYGMTEVAPVTGYGVLRLEQELGPSVSTAGLIVTGVRRDFTSGSSLGSILPRQAYAGAMDWNLKLVGSRHELGGHTGFSLVEGDPAAILEVQRASAHYYQRPDAGHVRLDSTRTSLTGYTMGLRVRRSAGPPWRLSGGITFESPGFELSDLGRQLQSDDIDAFADIRYFNPRPGPLFRFYAVSLGVRSGWNFGGTRQFSRLSLEARTTWLNFLATTASVGFSASALADNLTRGGPLMKTGGAWQVSGGLATNSNAKTRFRADATYYNNRTGTWSSEVGTGLSLQPSARFTVSVDPSYSRLVESRQYLTAMSRAGAATFGSRYVFAFVERSELAARFRLSYSLTPDLSLEVYAEPFAASGRFYDFGELAAPRTSQLPLYGTDGTGISRVAGDSVEVTDGAESFRLANPTSASARSAATWC